MNCLQYTSRSCLFQCFFSTNKILKTCATLSKALFLCRSVQPVRHPESHLAGRFALPASCPSSLRCGWPLPLPAQIAEIFRLLQNSPAKARPCRNRAPTVQMRKAQKRKASNLSIQRFSFGALAGTRIPGHLIKKTFQATFVKSALLETSLFSIHYHNFTLVALCIVCIPCIALHP